MPHAPDGPARALAVAVVLSTTAAGLAGAEMYTNSGMVALFANDHGGVVSDCPDWIREIFPGPRDPGCLTLAASSIRAATTLLDRTVADVAGIDWAGSWRAGDGGDPVQMLHRRIEVGGSGFVVTLRLAGRGGAEREVLVVIQQAR